MKTKYIYEVSFHLGLILGYYSIKSEVNLSDILFGLGLRGAYYHLDFVGETDSSQSIL